MTNSNIEHDDLTVDWWHNHPEITEEITEIARRGGGEDGDEHDYDTAHAELVKRGFHSEMAQHLILAAYW